MSSVSSVVKPKAQNQPPGQWRNRVPPYGLIDTEIKDGGGKIAEISWEDSASVLTLRTITAAIDHQGVIFHGKAVFGGDLSLPLLDGVVHELLHPAAPHTDDMVVVLALVELEYRGAALEVVAFHQFRRFELGQDPVDGGQGDILALLQQQLVDILGTDMLILALLQNLQDLDPGQCDFQSRLAYLLVFHAASPGCGVFPMLIGYHSPELFSSDTVVPRMRKLLISLLFLASLLASGCVPYYRPDIQQGNVVSQEMVDRLRPGMSKHQVQYILGTPLLIDVFHQERWDYFYSFEGKMTAYEKKRLSIFFENGRLARIAGDYRPKAKTDPLADGQRELHSVPDYDERTKGVIRRTWDNWREDDEEEQARAEPEEIVPVPDQERDPEEEKGFFGRMWDKVGLGDDEEEAAPEQRQPVRLTRPREEDWQDLDTPSETEETAAEPATATVPEKEEKGFFGSMWDKVGFGDDEEEAAPEPAPQPVEPEEPAVTIAPYRADVASDEPPAPAPAEPEAAAVEEAEPLIKQEPEKEEKGFFGSMWDKVGFGSDEEEAPAEETTPEGAAPVEERSTESEEKGFFGSMWDKVGLGSDEEEEE